MTSHWIFRDFKKDFAFLLLPGLIAAAIAFSLRNMSLVLPLLAFQFFGSAFMDSGHVYSTLWRTHFDTEERERSLQYWIIPILIFLFFFIWIYLRWPLLWTFVTYSTLYHNIKQFYGFNKYYQRLNNRFDWISDKYVLLNTLIPVFIFHNRKVESAGYYTDSDLFMNPTQSYYDFGMQFYFFCLATWFAYETFLFFQFKKIEWNRIFGILVPSVLYGIGFIFGNTLIEVLFPNVFSHAIGYYAIMSITLNNAKSFTQFSLKKLAFVIIIFAFVVGSLEFLIENHFGIIEPNYTKIENNFITAVLIALYLTPLFSHFIFDAIIWKYQNKRIPKLFEQSSFT
jgi:hypothetical protein